MKFRFLFKFKFCFLLSPAFLTVPLKISTLATNFRGSFVRYLQRPLRNTDKTRKTNPPTQGTATAPQGKAFQASDTAEATHAQIQANLGAGQQMVTENDRRVIWVGTLEWENLNTSEKETKSVPCQVSILSKEGEINLIANAWPRKLSLGLVPDLLIEKIGNVYLENSRSVYFHPTPCEALDSLIKDMTSGFAAGLIFYENWESPRHKDVLMLLYSAEEGSFLGFIPNDQSVFIDDFQKAYRQVKNTWVIKERRLQHPNQ